ncbi:MAG: 3-methyl-2-oxobutanoate hydroxymethyltransferase [Actinobacteria bacterium]|uniref:3-methyl-2-oxobutanoate hydroxymethyltransferase n=1 Tax=freshwater metagenome TaxID=449393 RepID=A0A6J5YK54_9ZZZZ|nr:3-methyl-2-oxobutanoate hydroxymethyltransferase [Actinomycetota bacterium]
MSTLYGGTPVQGRRITISDLAAAKERHEHWPMITCYDAITASIFDEVGFPVLLVGDSAGMVVLGYDDTIPVTVDQLVMLAAAVVRGSSRAMVVVDLPFGSCSTPEDAVANATRFMKESRAHAVKIEGGQEVVDTVSALVSAGIPVMGHIGLRPQHVHTMGGYRVQGRGDQAQQILADAQALQSAGVFAIVLEVIPMDLAQRITESIQIPTIGIGAGPHTDAQVMVWQDLVGLTPGKPAKFVKQYSQLRTVIHDASHAWAQDVIAGTYPDAEHSYS